jgi:hypothetical protein
MDELPLNKIIRLLLNAFSRTSYIYITVFHCFGYDNCHSAIAAEAGFVRADAGIKQIVLL